MFNFSQTIDPVTVLEKLRELGYYTDKTRDYVLQLMDITPTAAHAARYRRGVLLQTTAELEDDFDIEAMQQAEADQKKSFLTFVEQLRREYPDCLPMATGGCTLCPQCTYPDAPCRFPKKAIPSMEAYGLLVSKVCEKSGLPYYYGPRTLTYTSCVLID